MKTFQLATAVLGLVSFSSLSTLGLLSGCSHARPSAAPTAKSQAQEKYAYPVTQIYLKTGAIDPVTALPPPPAPGSKQDRLDFAALLHWQKIRTPGECARARTESVPDLETFFGPKYGPLSEAQVKQWQDFLDGAVRTDSDYYIQAVKNHWKRPRPYIIDIQLHPCIRKEGNNPAYPSGHAAFAQVYALILDRLDPAQKHAIDARARQIAQDRVLGGVHHPTDIRAGRKLGRELFRAFMKSPSFRKAFAELRAQSRAKSHAVPAAPGAFK